MKPDIGLSTRRDTMAMIAGAIGTFGCIAAGQQPDTHETTAKTNDALRTSLHQQIELPAPPKRVFEVLMDERQFAAVTGLSARIDPTAGGAFKTFGGLIEGRNVELIPAQRIVQAWREVSWEPGFYSLVHFELKAQGNKHNPSP